MVREVCAMKRRARALGIICCLLLAFAGLAGCGNQEVNQGPNQEVSQSPTPDANQDAGNDTTVQPSTAQTTEQPSTPPKQVEAIDIPQYEGYYLLWHDEFDGDSVNKDIWSIETRPPGVTNNELQEYTQSPDNVFIRDGKLVLKAIKTQKNGKDYYTSGKVAARKKEFLYGKVVVSAKVPKGQGLWPAIWMMPTKENHYGPWPRCGEIDIMEILGNQPHITYATIHYGEPHAQQQGLKALTDGTTFADDFHEYSVEWEPGEIRFYVDGELIHTVNDWFTAIRGGPEKPYPAPFDQPFFVQMNLAVGGNWPGNPDETTDFSKAEFEIDYVRVYQKPYYDTNVKKPEKQFREPLEDGNLIYNGDFAEAEELLDDINWKFLLFQGGEATAEIKDGMMIIKTKNQGQVDYSVQLVQADLPMYKGKKYRITFDARASEPRNMIVCVSAPYVNYSRYFQDTVVSLSTDWKTYTYEFTMKEKDDNNGRLEFNMGKAGSTADIYIRNVRVEIIE